MANQEHLELVKAGVNYFTVWLRNHPDTYFDLSGAVRREVT